MKSPNVKFSSLPVSAFLATVFALSACNTIEGAGRDIEATGDAIEGAAQDTKEELR